MDRFIYYYLSIVHLTVQCLDFAENAPAFRHAKSAFPEQTLPRSACKCILTNHIDKTPEGDMHIGLKWAAKPT